ncbi:MAG TPA: hypothetical protein VMP08_26430 [Anaerolineae bacterium]|nr:hypothetical protein [Anaerolineae bacterium]
MALIKQLTKTLLLLSLLALAGCSIDLSGSPHQPPQAIDRSALTPSESPAWASLKLSGHLIYVEVPRQIVQLDLVSGQKSILFDAPDNAYIGAVQASPDGKYMVIAYAPSAEPTLQSFNTDLYVMPTDGSAAPQVLLKRTRPKEDFINPVWSPDGKYIYYSHLMFDLNGANQDAKFTYDLERIAYPRGQPEKILGSASWPRLSRDGTKLAYVSLASSTNSNDLYIANADGSQLRLVMPAGSFFAVDAPVFSPDGQTILFSAVGAPQLSSLSWLDQLTGVQIAEAHNVPSDWWRVSVDGGKPERLTQVNGTGLYADCAPDGQYVAFMSVTGLFVMRPDGSNLVQLDNDLVGGTLTWVP